MRIRDGGNWILHFLHSFEMITTTNMVSSKMSLSNRGNFVSQDQSYWLIDQMNERFSLIDLFANMVREIAW